MCKNSEPKKDKPSPVSELLPIGGVVGKLLGTLGKLLPKKK
jgi:hypothetical protein